MATIRVGKRQPELYTFRTMAKVPYIGFSNETLAAQSSTFPRTARAKLMVEFSKAVPGETREQWEHRLNDESGVTLRDIAFIIGHDPPDCDEDCSGWQDAEARINQAKQAKAIVHWVRSTPITKPTEVRGLMCGTPYRPERMRASSYREQVTCKLCLLAPPVTPSAGMCPNTGEFNPLTGK